MLLQKNQKLSPLRAFTIKIGVTCPHFKLINVSVEELLEIKPYQSQTLITLEVMSFALKAGRRLNREGKITKIQKETKILNF